VWFHESKHQGTFYSSDNMNEMKNQPLYSDCHIHEAGPSAGYTPRTINLPYILNKKPPVSATDELSTPHYLQLVPTQNMIHIEMLDELVTDVGKMLGG
jgi:hypothetical protein